MADKISYHGSPIGTLHSLAKSLSITEAVLVKLVSEVEESYVVFQKQVKNKERTLCEPKPLLKIIQKRIVSRIFCHLEFPEYLHGGIKSNFPKDFFSNAASHLGAEVAVTFDIKSFFPSIAFSHVNHVFRYLLKFPEKVANALTTLVMLDGAVPQGAPTSSYIANIIMWKEEYRLVSRLRGQGFVYTRLLDDITISSKINVGGDFLGKNVDLVIKFLVHYGFSSNKSKFNIYYRKDSEKLMKITGLWINRKSPKLLPLQREKIASDVIGLRAEAKNPEVRHDEDYHLRFNQTSGRVALLNRLKHVEGRRLRPILQEISPLYNDYQVSKIKKLISRFCAQSSDRSKIGYIRVFYRFQYSLTIMRRTHLRAAVLLQKKLNLVRPTKTIKELET